MSILFTELFRNDSNSVIKIWVYFFIMAKGSPNCLAYINTIGRGTYMGYVWYITCLLVMMSEEKSSRKSSGGTCSKKQKCFCLWRCAYCNNSKVNYEMYLIFLFFPFLYVITGSCDDSGAEFHLTSASFERRYTDCPTSESFEVNNDQECLERACELNGMYQDATLLHGIVLCFP